MMGSSSQICFDELSPHWAICQVKQLLSEGMEIPEELQVLANRPYMIVSKHSSYAVNGYKFQTKCYGVDKATQNFGVAVVAQTSSFPSAKDQNPITSNVTYYGFINEIVELNYADKGSIVLFKCDWVDTVRGRGIQKDKFGITLVNFNYLLNNGRNIFDEPFILATQAKQVYYVQDPIDTEWHAVVFANPRDVFDLDSRDDDDDDDGKDLYFRTKPREPLIDTIPIDFCDGGNCARVDINGLTVQEPLDEAINFKRNKDGRKRKRTRQ